MKMLHSFSNSSPPWLFNPIFKSKSLIVGKSALAITNCNDQAKNLLDAFESTNFEIAHTNYTDLALEALIETPDAWDFVLLSLEKFNTVVILEKFVSQVRCINPKLPILLLSKDVNKSDRALMRTRLGDALIRESTTPKILAKTIAEVLSDQFELLSARTVGHPDGSNISCPRE